MDHEKSTQASAVTKDDDPKDENVKPASGLTEEETIQIKAVTDFMNEFSQKKETMETFVQNGPHVAHAVFKQLDKRTEQSQIAEETKKAEETKAVEPTKAEEKKAEETKKAEEKNAEDTKKA